MQYEITCSLVELFGQRTPELFSTDVLDATHALESVLRERGISALIRVTDVKAGRNVLNTVVIGPHEAGNPEEGPQPPPKHQ